MGISLFSEGVLYFDRDFLETGNNIGQNFNNFTD